MRADGHKLKIESFSENPEREFFYLLSLSFSGGDFMVT
jgi:hypothetical protein